LTEQLTYVLARTMESLPYLKVVAPSADASSLIHQYHRRMIVLLAAFRIGFYVDEREAYSTREKLSRGFLFSQHDKGATAPVELLY